jgi:hypothetical protein
MKIFHPAIIVLYFLLLSAVNAYAVEIDCKATEAMYQDKLNALSRQCSKKSDCASANLSWDPCGKPVLYSQPGSVAALSALLNELTKLCPRAVRPCPLMRVQPICLDGMCEDALNPGSSMTNKTITIQFMHQSRPLAGMQVALDADTGIRCATAPCPSSRNIKSFTTNAEGKITMTVTEILGILNMTASTAGSHSYVGPDGYSLSINNVGYTGIDLAQLLVNTQKVVVIAF